MVYFFPTPPMNPHVYGWCAWCYFRETQRGFWYNGYMSNGIKTEKEKVSEQIGDVFADSSLTLSESIWVFEQHLYSIADGANGLQKHCIDPAENDISQAIRLLKIARAKLEKEGF